MVSRTWTPAARATTVCYCTQRLVFGGDGVRMERDRIKRDHTQMRRCHEYLASLHTFRRLYGYSTRWG